MGTRTDQMWLNVSEEQWKSLIGRLALRTTKRVNRLFWRGAYGGVCPEGREALDFVSHAIVQTISEEQAWNPAERNLYSHLWNIISTNIWNLVNRKENQERRLNSGIHGENVIGFPDPIYPAILRADELRSLREFLLEYYSNKLWLLAELMLVDEIVKTDALSCCLGCSAREIENLKKQLRRAMTKYCEIQGITL